MDSISDLKERKLLKDILTGVFLNLVDYDEKMFLSLSKDIFDEIPYEENKYTIYTSVVNREDYDPVNEFLYPMLQDDLQEHVISKEEFFEVMGEGEGYKVDTYFFQCDYLILKDLLQTDYFEGEIVTEEKSYKAVFKLQKNNQYPEIVESLYKTFVENSIPWTTINMSYMSKFVDVYVTECKEEVPEEETVKGFHVALGKYDKYKEIRSIPVWNIEHLFLPSRSYPIPAMDHIHFQHEVSLSKEGEGHGYLVDVKESLQGYVKRNPDTITIVSTRDGMVQWGLLKIVQYKEDILLRGILPIISNHVEENFTNRLGGNYGRSIRTRAELARQMNRFDVSKRVKMVGFTVEDKADDAQSYPMDFFLKDEIREENYKKYLVFQFEAIEMDFITRDTISFLVSQVQQLFPEYICVGGLKGDNPGLI